MKIVAIIPARYKSTRFEGKPLADICGHPMIWWVYKRVSEVKKFNDVFVAIDDERIRSVCEKLGIKYIMTRNDHPEHISRIHEVSERIQADLYVCINGDEPLISPQCIEQAVPDKIADDFFFSGARCVYISRTPVPYPKGTLLFKYNKYVGIECFSKKALDFFVSTPQGSIERIEDIDHLRFLEHGKELNFVLVDSESISVDTPKDLEKVVTIIQHQNINY